MSEKRKETKVISYSLYLDILNGKVSDDELYEMLYDEDKAQAEIEEYEKENAA